MAHLSLLQRNQIETGIAQGKSNAQIARETGVHRATIGREIRRNALNREWYEAKEAHEHAQTTQRMAVSFRNFEGLGSFRMREEKEESISSGADFFQLESYYRSKTFQFFPLPSVANSERNRYTNYERIHDSFTLTIKDKPLFSNVQFNLFSSHFLNFSTFTGYVTRSLFLQTSLCSLIQSHEIEKIGATALSPQSFSPLSAVAGWPDNEAFNPLFNRFSTFPVVNSKRSIRNLEYKLRNPKFIQSMLPQGVSFFLPVKFFTPSFPSIVPFFLN